MEFTKAEGLRNAGNICIDLADAMKPDSDGGATLTTSEIINIIIKNGVKIVEDVQDEEPTQTP